MSLRLLLGFLASGPETQHEALENGGGTLDTDKIILNYDFKTPAKFHIGMLSISLITGLAYGGFVSYTYWKEKDTFLGYIRNLVIALVCRTFFSILFDGVILLGSLSNVGGGNTLLAFEQICLNLVLGFWLSLTVYLHARCQRNFNSEPSLRIYQYGVPGVALFFAFVWIFTLQSKYPNILWWFILESLSQWVAHSVNLLFLLIQLGLTVDIVRMMMIKKNSLDSDSVSLLWKAGSILGVLVFIFWLQFGLMVGRLPLRNASSYVNFYSFVDGSECALVCLCLYFLYKWVLAIINKIPSLMPLNLESASSTMTESSSEVLLPGNGGRGIVTIDSVFMTRESGRWKYSEEGGANDVVYSSVVEPDRLKKTLDLYKRMNVFPKQQLTVVEGDQFFDCRLHREKESRKWSEKHQNVVSSGFKQNSARFKSGQIFEFQQNQKKNAFYSSKYLILDPKEGSIPKYLETRPSVSSLTEKRSPILDRTSSLKDLNSIGTEDLVNKWLDDTSTKMGSQEKNKNAEINEKNEAKLKKPDTGENLFKNEETAIPPAGEMTHLIAGKEESVPSTSYRIKLESPHRSAEAESTGTSLIQNEYIPLTTSTSNSGIPTEKNEPLKETTTSFKTESEKPLAPIQSFHSSRDSSEKLVPQQNKSNIENLQPPVLPTPDFSTKEKPKKFTDPYITYSELLEFRSQRDKAKPPEDKKDYSSFSDSIFSSIDNLLRLNFFSLIKPSPQENKPNLNIENKPREPEIHSQMVLEAQPTREDEVTSEPRENNKKLNEELPLMREGVEKPRENYLEDDLPVSSKKPRLDSSTSTPVTDQPEPKPELQDHFEYQSNLIRQSKTTTTGRKSSFEDKPNNDSTVSDHSASRKNSLNSWISKSDTSLNEPNKTRTEASDSSSESEFSIEKRKSSTESFSLERYYAEVSAAGYKILNPVSPLRGMQNTNISPVK